MWIGWISGSKLPQGTSVMGVFILNGTSGRGLATSHIGVNFLVTTRETQTAKNFLIITGVLSQPSLHASHILLIFCPNILLRSTQTHCPQCASISPSCPYLDSRAGTWDDTVSPACDLSIQLSEETFLFVKADTLSFTKPQDVLESEGIFCMAGTDQQAEQPM
eukprot:1147985-Pelagomonas_calceolata.AAC.1